MRPCASHSARQRRRSAATPAAVWYRSSAVLASSFITIAESGPGIPFARSPGGDRLPGDVAMDPLHRIGGGEGQRPRQHLVEGDAQRIEIAPGIDRPVHAAGLLGRHVGERPGDHLGRLGGLALARQTRGDAEAGQPDRAGRGRRPGCWPA